MDVHDQRRRVEPTRGSVGYRQATDDGAPIYEAGWSVATPFQGHASRSPLSPRAFGAQRCTAIATRVRPPQDRHAASNALPQGRHDLDAEEDFEYCLAI